MKDADTNRTTVIEVISFLIFTLFAMVLAFFTSAKVFAKSAPDANPELHRAQSAWTAPAPATPTPRLLPR